jgi:hypothetical protein
VVSIATGPEWVESDLVFTSQLGHVIHPDTFTWLTHKLIKAHNADDGGEA